MKYSFLKKQSQVLRSEITYANWNPFNDTHKEKLLLYWIQYKNSLKCKVGCFWRFSYVYTFNYVLLVVLSYRCLKNVVHQIDGKRNEWLLLSVTFTAKLDGFCFNIRKRFFLEFAF